MLNKLSNKKKSKINKSKQKSSLRQTKLTKTTISRLSYSNKNQLLFSILAIKKLSPKTKNINKAIIKANIYYTTYHLRKA